MRSRSAQTLKLPVYRQIAGAIEHQVELGRYASGDRIPSIRELCEQFGVGDVTIKRALRRLQQRGVIRAVVGSGSYVAPRSSRETGVRTALGAAVVMLGPPPRAVFQHEVNLIQRGLQRRGHTMFYCAVEFDAQLPDTLAHLHAANTGCLIVFPRHGVHPLPPPGADLLNDRGMPVLVLETPDPERAHVAADVESASALLVDHLYRLGHRRLWLATRYQRKINGFRDAVARWADPALDTHIVPASCDSLREMRQVAEQIVRAQPRPTAVIACNDSMAELFIEHFADAGLRVPADISVAAYDDHPNFATGVHQQVAITTVRHPADEIAEEVARWAHDRLSGKPQDAPLRRSITGSLIVRDSTAPPPQDYLMDDRSFPVNCAGERLTAALNPGQLGLAPERVWNPSPSVHHRTTPYDLPQRLTIGLRGNDETGAKFSPPPFAVVVESGASRVLVAVRADAGFHLWNNVVFDTDAKGVRVEIDLEGQSDPTAVAPHVSVHVIAGEPGESRHQLLARGLRQLYPQASAQKPQVPEWWLRPSYCGWGDQVSVSMWLEGVGPERRANAYCTQGLYERWIKRLDEADVPIGTVTIDAGWSPTGVWEPDEERWPDLRGFIARQHERGRKVLLWIATWLCDGMPDEWCVFAHGQKLCADPTNPEYRRSIRERVRTLISPDGFDADGFKVDQLAWAPSRRAPLGGPRFGWMVDHKPSDEPIRLAGPGWGVELLYQYQKGIYDSAIAAKPDALVTSSTVHPYFHDTFSMVRLHDMGFVAPDIFEAMGARAALSEAALPGKPIDADDWVHSDYDLWLRYTTGSRRIGVPCTLYAERFVLNWEREPGTKLIPLDDLRRIGDAWRASPASPAMQTSEAHA